MQTQLATTAYRKDIDGLRGIAIALVIIYHAFPTLLPAGFIGVDVFFVISGFLITGIIVKQENDKRFSYLDFYRRRTLRLVPSLLALIAACLIAGWFWLLPNEFRELSKHAGGSAFFMNNIILFTESGYFDTAIDTKPLMHLWSLGVEEQFYLLWPITLLFLLKRQRVIVGACLLAISSLLLCLYWQRTLPSAAFYLPFSRLWQFLAGALLAYALIKKNYTPNPRQANLLSLCGTLCLLSAIFLLIAILSIPIGLLYFQPWPAPAYLPPLAPPSISIC